MRGLKSHPLQLLDDPAAGSSEQPALGHPPGLGRGDRDRAEWHACREAWRPYPPRRPTSAHEPYTLAWFRDLEERRYSRHGRWIPKLFSFNRHRGEQVLALGGGLGTDWCKFAEGGAHVHFATPDSEQLALVRRNFELRGLSGRFMHAPTSNLPLAGGAIDVAVLFPSGDEGPRAADPIGEVFRVLKPGGKVIAVLPAMYNARWWQDFWFPWARWFQPPPAGGDERYTGRELRRLFEPFTVRRIVKRHLRRSDIPRVWRWMLLPVLERVMGRYLIAKAFKPLPASEPLRAAA